VCKIKYADNRILYCWIIDRLFSYMRIIPAYGGKICLRNEPICSIVRYNLFYILSSVPPNPKKIEALRSCGVLNRHPEEVRNPLFTENEFFDPHDLVQLKYETIRGVEVDGRPIAQAALDSGLSRPTIYEARENFRQEGIEGLLPEKRGPQKAAQAQAGSSPLSPGACWLRARS
jgi:hypothetical protein